MKDLHRSIEYLIEHLKVCVELYNSNPRNWTSDLVADVQKELIQAQRKLRESAQ